MSGSATTSTACEANVHRLEVRYENQGHKLAAKLQRVSGWKKSKAYLSVSAKGPCRVLSLGYLVCPLCDGKVREIEVWYPQLTMVEKSTMVGYRYSCESCGCSAFWSSGPFSCGNIVPKFNRFLVRARLHGGHADAQVLSWWPDDQSHAITADGVEIKVYPIVKKGRVRWRRRTKIAVDYPSLRAAVAATRAEHIAIADIIAKDPPVKSLHKAHR